MADIQEKTPAEGEEAMSSPLDALSEAIESGAGLPQIARAASAALGADVALIDAGGSVLAVIAGSPGRERELLGSGDTVTELSLRVAEATVGHLRFRPRSELPEPAMIRMVSTLLALEVERTRAPERAGEALVGGFVSAVLDRQIDDSRNLIARGKELGIDLEHGGSVLVVRVHPRRAAEGDWQARALTVLARGARSAVPAALAALRNDHIAVLVPGADATLSLRAAESALRSAESGMTGFVVVIGRSRVVADPMDLHRAAAEAVLAANVATPADESVLLSFEDTGAYRLLLPAMSEDPAELERFYSDTIAPLIAYDEQYGTELVHTLETFLDNDGSMAATYKQLYTHRHTIRYRLERVKELTGLDVSSTDGRERLGLGLKAMRVLGVRAPVAPVFEPGAESGRVPKPRGDEMNTRRR
jgi:PucR family transcriptional regulator, purine catabolism regulatory protein